MLRGFLIGLLSSLLCARAQNTSVSCSSTYDWLRNSQGQSPCLVAAWLQNPCDGAYEVGAPTYLGPTNGTACACSTVSYSTLAACAVCQGAGLGGIAPWPIFSQHCQSVAIQRYPQVIPNGTSIPAWAYMPLLNNTFDVKAAQYLASLANTSVISATGTTSSNPISLSASTSAPPFTSGASSASASPSDATQQARPSHIEGSALVAVMVVSLLGLSAALAGIVVVARRRWLPRIQVGSPRTSTLRMPTLRRVPSFYLPTLRIPSLRIPALRMPALRVPALPTPTLQLPAWAKRRGQREPYTDTESKLHMFYDPNDPRTFPPPLSPADIYFYRCRQKAAAMNPSPSSNGRSYVDVTVTLGETPH